MIGIYKITNLSTGEVYIGQSKKLEKRQLKIFQYIENLKKDGYNINL